MKTFQEFITEAYSRGPVRGRDYDDYKGMKPRGLGGKFQTQDKTPPTHPAAHLKPKKKSAAERMDAAGKRLGLPEEYIDETSLNRVRSKSEKGGMAIMSAQRGDKSKKENKARSKQLEKDIRGAGLPGPTKVSGRYTENPGTSQEKKVGEKSHVVSSGKMGKRKFKKAIEKLGKKYDQDSVLIQRKPKGSATIKGTSKTSWPGKGKNVGVGKMNPGKTGEFDTKVKNKTFTYEEYEN
jgi:hypothetical protein